MNNEKTIEKNYKNFIAQICETELVYALENEDRFATSQSIQFENEEGEPTAVICFWSSKELASVCIKDDWKGYHVTSIKLPDFIENWCVGMHYDSLVLGTEFDQDMFGQEAQPLELILALTIQLKAMNKDVKLSRFKGITDIAHQVRNLIESEL